MDLSKIDLQQILIQVAVLLLSLSFHESAHAWSADKLGDRTSRLLGRVSLNPIVHIDPIGTVLLPLFSMLSGVPVIGWAKPVPVNPLNLTHPRRDSLWIAAAGPISNLILAAVCGVTIMFWHGLAGPSMYVDRHPVWTPLLSLLVAGLFINVALAFFNLIPVPPLDGGGILYGLLPDEAAEAYDRIRPYGFLILLALLWLGLTTLYLRPIMEFVERIVFA